MNSLDSELQSRLETLRAQGLWRGLRRVDSPQGTRLRLGGCTLLNFSSNDYLGLANDARLQEAVLRAVERFGVGAGASRLICGSLAPHHELEEALAAFQGTEAALTFSTGYATALGAISALIGKDDVIVLDKLVHACVVDAARLSGAKLRVFAHNDLGELDAVLKWTNTNRQSATGRPPSRVLVVTESVFSMDGDFAPLREIVELKERYGAWLMVDEAHATGIHGPRGRGLASELGVADQIEVHLGTLGKALGTSGGYIAGSRALVEYLVNRARSFIFSTAPPAAVAAAATAAVQLVQTSVGDRLRQRLWQRVQELQARLPASSSASPKSTPSPGGGAGGLREEISGLASRNRSAAGGVTASAPGFGDRTDGAHGVPRPGWRFMERAGAREAATCCRSAIIPLIVGDESAAVELSARLRERGIFIPAIRYPSVARGRARLRMTLTAAHSRPDLGRLLRGLRDVNLGMGT